MPGADACARDRPPGNPATPRYVIPATILVILVSLAAAFAMVRHSRVEWATTQALPEIPRLVNQEKYSAAFALASRAEKYIPKDPALVRLWDDFSIRLSVKTTPEGADVYRRDMTRKRMPGSIWANRPSRTSESLSVLTGIGSSTSQVMRKSSAPTLRFSTKVIPGLFFQST
jgi:hypothetical protein